MFLDADKTPTLVGSDTAPSLPSEPWRDFPHSQLSDHGAECCAVARHWICAMDFAQLNGGDLHSGPRWMRHRYKWGPTKWPIHWCDAVQETTLDCGAHAALAHAAFAARGVTSFPAQFVQQYSAASTEEWRSKWVGDEASDHWIGEDMIYHEGVAVLAGSERIRFWDSSAGWWIDPGQNGGYGSLIAVRIWADADAVPAGSRWGEYDIRPGHWLQIGG